MGQTCNTGCEGSSYIGIDQSHLSCFVVVLIMHVVNQVQDVNIQRCTPVKHDVIFMHNFIEIKVLGSNRCDFRTALHMLAFFIKMLLILTTIDSVKETFSKVSTSTEELDLLTSLCSGYTAADAVVIAPDRLHNIIVLILDGRCVNRNLSCILLEVLRKSA